MKKLILIMLMMFQMNFAFGQTPQCEAWSKNFHYSGISARILEPKYLPDVNKYAIQLRVRNTYTKKATFNIKWIAGEKIINIGQLTLNPGESYDHTPLKINSIEESYDYLEFKITNICLDGTDCNKTGYENWVYENQKSLVSEVYSQALDIKPKNGIIECMYKGEKHLQVYKDESLDESYIFFPNGKIATFRKKINGNWILTVCNKDGKPGKSFSEEEPNSIPVIF